MIAYYATREHYVDHLAPIWQQTRGDFYVSPEATLLERCTRYGIPYKVGPPPRDRVAVVAAGMDLGSRERCVLVEHGAGQSYREVHHVSWSGGESRENVELFIVPNARAGARNAVRYPDTHNVICAPRVEHLRNVAERSATDEFDVVFGRHWDTYLCPELSSAWPHHFETIRDYCKQHRFRTALHFHPRCADVGKTLAREWGVEYLDTFEEVVMHARVFVVDNSSAGFEWAALDRPVIWLNAPYYRRHVEHGLRFWSHVDVGTQVDDPALLEWAIDNALRYDPMASLRRDLIRDVFPIIDGSALRAAAAIERIA